MPALDLVVETFQPSNAVLENALKLAERHVTHTGKPGEYVVISGPRSYKVQLGRHLWECQCLAYTEHRRLCKHALAAMAWENRYPTLPEIEVDLTDPFEGLG